MLQGFNKGNKKESVIVWGIAVHKVLQGVVCTFQKKSLDRAEGGHGSASVSPIHT
jgi:hypothetical protein